MQFETRVQNLRNSLQARADFFFTSHLPNVRYLTGFSGSNGAVLVSQKRVWLYTDGRYTTQAKAEATFDELVIERNPLSLVVKTVGDNLSLAFEKQHFSYLDHQQLAKFLHLVETEYLVEDLRMVKEPTEIAALSRACEITSEAWQILISQPLIGQSESGLAAKLEFLFRELGAEDRAFESIVATGSNSAIPHHQPTDRLVAAGDFLKIDAGARFSGYHADMTRTIVVGASAADWQREIYEVVSTAAAVTRDAAQPGADSEKLDDVARKVVQDAGFAEYFTHPTGHGVGLEIHERPFLGRKDGILRPHMPVTVEPGIYLPGRGGVRIEDTILISDTGHTSLTTANRELLEIQ